jgi:hypothetical protein
MTCPFCKEEIKEGAIKCKHCGSNINNKRIEFSQNYVEKKLEDLLNVAKAQKGIIWCILIGLLIWPIIYIIGANVNNEEDLAFPAGILWFSLIVLLCFQIVYVYRLATALKKSIPVLWTIGSLFSCIGIIILLVLSGQATKIIREAGFKVGLMGANINIIQNEINQKQLI